MQTEYQKHESPNKEIIKILILSLLTLPAGFIGTDSMSIAIIQNVVEGIIDEIVPNNNKLNLEEFTVNTITKSIPIIQTIINQEKSQNTGDYVNAFDGATITVHRNNGVVQVEKIIKDIQVERSWQIPDGAKLFSVLHN